MARLARPVPIGHIAEDCHIPALVYSTGRPAKLRALAGFRFEVVPDAQRSSAVHIWHPARSQTGIRQVFPVSQQKV